MSRTFIIGDIHGQVELLDALLSHIPLALHDRLVFLGDYIDYGPYSAAVIERLAQLLQDGRWEVSCLMGNHEHMFIEWLDDSEIIKGLPPRYLRARQKMGADYRDRLISQWEWNDEYGAAATLRSYGYGVPGCRGKLNIPRHHKELLSSLSLFHEGDGWLALHAGVGVEKRVIEARTTREAIKSFDSIKDLLWNRHLISKTPTDVNWEFRIICGHTIVEQPYVTQHVIGVDIGAKMCHGLCAFCPENDTFYFQNGEKNSIGGSRVSSAPKVIELA